MIGELDIDKLKALADSVPIANMLLGDIYSGKTYDESKKDDEQAAFYYMKADEHALLGKFSARWLLNYHRNGGNVNLSEKDIERFEKLASMRSSRPEDRLCEEMEVETDEFDYDGIEAVDTIEVDTIEVE